MYDVAAMDKLKQDLENATYEKIAIDQMYVESLKSAVSLRSSLLCYEAQNKELRNKIESLEDEVKRLKDLITNKYDPVVIHQEECISSL